MQVTDSLTIDSENGQFIYRSANAEMLAEAPEPTASPEPALLPASTSLAGWQGDDLGGTANPALKAGPVTFEQNTPTRQPPQPAVSGPTCGDSPQQDPMVCFFFAI